MPLLMTENDSPAFDDRYRLTPPKYTVAALFGSTARWMSYQHCEPHEAAVAVACAQLVPPSMLRKMPSSCELVVLCSAAYIVSGPLGAIAMRVRPMFAVGSPVSTRVGKVTPP